MTCNTVQAAAHSHDIPYLVGGLILTVAGITATSIGGWLLYTGLQPKKKKKRPIEESLLPTLNIGAGGMSAGFGGSFTSSTQYLGSSTVMQPRPAIPRALVPRLTKANLGPVPGKTDGCC